MIQMFSKAFIPVSSCSSSESPECVCLNHSVVQSLTHAVSVSQYFSSGIYCQHSPQFDDLFGFSVEDVMEEVKRGSKLVKIIHIFVNRVPEAFLLVPSLCWFRTRCVTNVRKRAPLLGVRSNAARSPTTTRALFKTELRLLRTHKREYMGQSNTSVRLHV